ncbi:extracellular solute-binding protein [Tsukamurella sp. 1534]|uniref:extracellular solute-binding protein n=1 Tax=Tsukamurella sp. 1534 TaxID=1151061 RepID=UPI0002DF786A|nr:extracellular solute-binding protein [Tsukamurella sp. 1534]
MAGEQSRTRRSRGARLGAMGMATAVGATLLAGCGTGSGGIEISVYVGADSAPTVARAAEKCSNDEFKVVGYSLPKSADDARLQLARRVTGGDKTLDILGLDVTWTAEFAQAGWAVKVPADLAERTAKRVLPGPLKTGMYNDEMYAVPAWTNTQLLWYRKDLLSQLTGKPVTSPPRLTWAQLLELTAKSRAQRGPTQIGVTAAQYEGLTVWFNSMLESAGGKVVDETGKKVVLGEGKNREAAVKALTAMKSVATAPGHDPSFSQTMETEIRLGMERGNALFELNWPFVLSAMQENSAAGSVPFLPEMTKFADVAKDPTNDQLKQMNQVIQKKFDFARFPDLAPGVPARPTIGGGNYAVSPTSVHQEQAWKAIECLTNEESEKAYGLDAGTPPVLPSLYDDPEYLAVYPMAKLIRDQLQENTSSVRPVTPVYQAMSTLMQAKLSPVGSWDPEALVDELATAAEKAIDQKGLVP